MSTQTHLTEESRSRFKFWKKFPKPSKGASKKLFWTWIAYQTIKGTLTTAFIWIPLIYAMLKS